MATRVSRRLEFADRFARQQADQAIKKDIVRALVELITNSDDSYKRLESRGISTNGQIIVEILRKHRGSTISVSDLAEGMDGTQMDDAVGIYAGETSGFSKGAQVRGYFGRGLKDAILGLGEGVVTGTVNNKIHQASLTIRNSSPFYEAQQPVPLLGFDNSNGTSVEITVTREDIRISFFDNIRGQLSLHYALRDILSSENRTIILKNRNARSLQESSLAYLFPTGKLMARTAIPVGNAGKKCDVELFRSDFPLDTPRESGYMAQAGLLIKSGTAILDNTLLGFDNDPNAQRFYGSILCPHLNELLLNDEQIVTATRDGLDRSHPFVSELFRVCEEFLKEFVEKETLRARATQQRTRSRELQQKLNSAISKLNDIARDELAELDQTDNSVEEPLVPPSGFGFVPEYASLYSTRKKNLLLRATANLIPEGTLVTINSDSPNVRVLTPRVVLQPREDHQWLNETKVTLEGIQVGAEAIITAACEGLTAESLVRVIARREPSDNNDDTPRKRRGLFNDIQFSPESNPRQRVRYDRQSKDVVIAINHATVSPYIYDSTGTGSDSPQGQVILAELISEAVCDTIARNGVESGKFPVLVGEKAEAIQVQQLRLQNEYSGLIHEALVSPEFRTPNSPIAAGG